MRDQNPEYLTCKAANFRLLYTQGIRDGQIEVPRQAETLPPSYYIAKSGLTE